MFRIKAFAALAGFFVLLPGSALAAAVYDTAVVAAYYSDSRSILGSPGGLVRVGGGAQFTDATLSWSITDPIPGDGLLHYTYSVVTHSQSVGVSHFILDLSDNCTASGVAGGNCFTNFVLDSGGTSSTLEFGTFNSSDGVSNPGMTGSIVGLKVNISGGATSYSFSFDSSRLPVWEDFYSKGGRGTTNGFAFENAGLGNETTSENIFDFIALPDGLFIEPVPEPATLALFGAGLLGLGTLRRRRRS